MKNGCMRWPVLPAGRHGATGPYEGIVRIVLAVLMACLIAGGFASAMTLTECIDLALENNPSIKAARENLNAASARMGQAGSAALPSVTLSATKGKNYSQPMTITLPPVMGGGTITTAPDEPSDYTSYTLGVQQPLFTGGKILTGMTIARGGYDIASEELKKAEQDVEFNVTKSYYDYLKARKQIEIIDSTAKNLGRNLGITTVLFDSGIASESEVLRIRTAAANLDFLRIQARSGRDIARLALESWIGTRLDDSISLEEEELKPFSVNVPERGSLLLLAYENRPDYVSFKQALRIAESAVNLAYSGYLPNIAFSYQTGNAKNEYNKSTSSNTDINSWRAMFVGSWTLFNGFSTENQVREAFASLNSAKAQEQMIKDGISLDVSSSRLSLVAAAEKVIAAQLAADLATKALKSVEVSYGANISSRQIYLETQTSYLIAVTDLWNAKYDLQIAGARLNKAVGKKIL
jgi:outer membrane protein